MTVPQKTAEALADRIIRNTYRTLMTRGRKGCYVYCVDRATNDYFKGAVAAVTRSAQASAPDLLRVAETEPGYVDEPM